MVKSSMVYEDRKNTRITSLEELLQGVDDVARLSLK